MAWTPGQVRKAHDLEVPFEDVPLHLARPLLDWIVKQLDGDGVGGLYGANRDKLRALGTYLRLAMPESPQDQVATLFAEFDADLTYMLTVVEAMLELWVHSDYSASIELRRILSLANSLYTVRDDAAALEEVVTPSLKQQVREVVGSAQGSAGEHLTNAWNAAYGVQSDPGKSYSESIKSVESAFAPLVSPQNSKQTLGTMVADLSNKPVKWTFVLPDGVGLVTHMMKSLWDGQTSRHGGLGQTRPETLAEARAAVHLAAPLVQFGIGGSFLAVSANATP